MSQQKPRSKITNDMKIILSLFPGYGDFKTELEKNPHKWFVHTHKNLHLVEEFLNNDSDTNIYIFFPKYYNGNITPGEKFPFQTFLNDLRKEQREIQLFKHISKMNVVKSHYPSTIKQDILKIISNLEFILALFIKNKFKIGSNIHNHFQNTRHLINSFINKYHKKSLQHYQKQKKTDLPPLSQQQQRQFFRQVSKLLSHQQQLPFFRQVNKLLSQQQKQKQKTTASSTKTKKRPTNVGSATSQKTSIKKPRKNNDTNVVSIGKSRNKA